MRLKLASPAPGASVVGARLDELPTTLGNKVLMFVMVVPENTHASHMCLCVKKPTIRVPTRSDTNRPVHS